MTKAKAEARALKESQRLPGQRRPLLVVARARKDLDEEGGLEFSLKGRGREVDEELVLELVRGLVRKVRQRPSCREGPILKECFATSKRIALQFVSVV